jgi:hypothetical protein
MWASFLLCSLGACAHRSAVVREETPSSPTVHEKTPSGPTVLRTGASALDPTWQRMKISGASVALHHPDGAAIAASWACDQKDEEAPLDVLTNHLLFELDDRKEHGREKLQIDGRAALRTNISASLDGVPVELALVVFKKDGCVVDAQLVTRAGGSEDEAAFVLFIGGLGFSRGRK